MAAVVFLNVANIEKYANVSVMLYTKLHLYARGILKEMYKM